MRGVVSAMERRAKLLSGRAISLHLPFERWYPLKRRSGVGLAAFSLHEQRQHQNASRATHDLALEARGSASSPSRSSSSARSCSQFSRSIGCSDDARAAARPGVRGVAAARPPARRAERSAPAGARAALLEGRRRRATRWTSRSRASPRSPIRSTHFQLPDVRARRSATSISTDRRRGAARSTRRRWPTRPKLADSLSSASFVPALNRADSTVRHRRTRAAATARRSASPTQATTISRHATRSIAVALCSRSRSPAWIAFRLTRSISRPIGDLEVGHARRGRRRPRVPLRDPAGSDRRVRRSSPRASAR